MEKHIDELNLTHISAIFHKSTKHSVSLNMVPLTERLDYLINNNECEANAQHVSNLLYGIRNYSNTADTEHMSFLLITITRVIERCTSSIPTGQNVGNSLLGLTGLSSSDSNVRALLAALTPLLSKCTEKLSPQNVSNALYSLVNFDIDDGIEIENLIIMITKHITRTDVSISGQSLTNSTYSLQRMNSSSKVVRKLMVALTRLILRGRPEHLCSGQLISNSLYGLSNSRSINYEVRELLVACLPHFRKCGIPVLAQHLSNCMLGLQGMSTYYPEVRLVIMEVTRLFPICTETFNGQCVGNSVYGLQNLETCYEVKALIRELVIKISQSQDEIKAQEIANAIFGLQSLSNESCPEILSLIRALEKKCSLSNEEWTPNHIQQVFGLQLMTSCPEIDGLLSQIKKKIFEHCCEFTSYQEIGNCLYGLNRLYDFNKDAVEIATYLLSKINLESLDGDINEIDWRSLIHGLVPLTELERSTEVRRTAQIILNKMLLKCKQFEGEDTVSKNETQCKKSLQAALALYNGIKITTNKFIFGYSYDILIEKSSNVDANDEMKSEEGVVSLINVEIDGPTHKNAKSIHFHDIRDSYFKSNGIIVLRYDLMDEAYPFEDFLKLLKAYIE